MQNDILSFSLFIYYEEIYIMLPLKSKLTCCSDLNIGNFKEH